MTDTHFYRKQVENFDPNKGIEDERKSYRLTCEYDDDQQVMLDLIDKFCSDPKATSVNALVIGMWGEPWDCSSEDTVKKLVENKDKLQQLEALYIGDMTFEDCEISWIIQSNVEAVFEAFPNLKLLKLRGGNELELGTVKHESLEALIIHTGGVGKSVLHSMAGAELPSLKYLEIWLGTDEYGFDGSVEDVKPLMKADLFPNLTFLGLQNSCIADDIAIAFAEQTLQETLKHVDFSMGVMTDKGMEVLMSSGVLNSLETLNVESNYLSEKILTEANNSLSLSLISGSQKEDEDEDDEDPWRYVDVGE
ncbi:STM4015 family protein [Aureibacter tunicatorum]|uniref:Leucine Rich repeat-containing protein n=1 Tax=Aureibacter tunicatorum TaxID=866807 RepID=A0AAE3XPW3_9BACT|nr:STM4015 family protein [Aureibacter tunicatorum]MDR6239865.1 hypothetical protein [Aureibacter tunicatorum]BDD04340.1 hypothetical protein AUTU_18230 [Aureibacter tunicatorum]